MGISFYNKLLFLPASRDTRVRINLSGPRISYPPRPRGNPLWQHFPTAPKQTTPDIILPLYLVQGHGMVHEPSPSRSVRGRPVEVMVGICVGVSAWRRHAGFYSLFGLQTRGVNCHSVPPRAPHPPQRWSVSAVAGWVALG